MLLPADGITAVHSLRGLAPTLGLPELPHCYSGTEVGFVSFLLALKINGLKNILVLFISSPINDAISVFCIFIAFLCFVFQCA